MEKTRGARLYSAFARELHYIAYSPATYLILIPNTHFYTPLLACKPAFIL